MLGSSSNVDTAGNNSASPLTSASVTSPAALTKEARGRVTRSSLGKAPLSLKSCEQVKQTYKNPVWSNKLNLIVFALKGIQYIGWRGAHGAKKLNSIISASKRV